MLTFRGQDFQYFRVGFFDFHRARAPDRLLDIGRLSASNAWLFGCADSGSRHGREQPHALASRRAEYAKQILRAVLRPNGVVIPGNPLGQETAGRDRITITTAKGDPAPIPPGLLGAWWRAATRAPSLVASDYYRFQLLTGCRGVEIHGHKPHRYPPIWVGDVDHRAGRVLMRDKKTRAITSCCSPGRRFRSRSATAQAEGG
jgi:hypothetical protein